MERKALRLWQVLFISICLISLQTRAQQSTSPGSQQVAAASGVKLLNVPVGKATLAERKFPPVTITGTIVNAAGEPVAGVVIEVKGLNQSTLSDASGNFTLTVPNGNETLVISHVGFTTQEIAVNNRASINVSLVTSAAELQDVVVVGYGTRRRGDVTGAIATLSAEKIRQIPVTNATQALQGRVPG
jgi:hypothetical protein